MISAVCGRLAVDVGLVEAYEGNTGYDSCTSRVRIG
jgi:hypothetical protein